MKCCCLICKREMSVKGIHTHLMRTHGSEEEKSKFHLFTKEDIMKGKENNNHLKQRIERAKKQNTKICSWCNNTFTARYKKFCNNSCAAHFKNAHRDHTSIQQKRIETIRSTNPEWGEGKTSPTIKKVKTKAQKKSKQYVKEGPFCVLYNCKCKMCKKQMLLQHKRQFCDACSINHTNLRMQYQFRFNVYNFPELFDLNLLAKQGWYSPKGKSGKWNPNGLSRDHKVSVHEAIMNNYDLFYITHPLNCDLIPHSQNNHKKTKSSLLYDDLVKMVDEYEGEGEGEGE